MHTSSAYSAWDGSDCGVHAAQTTNSSSLPPPRTSASWPRSFPHRSNRGKPDNKGTHGRFKWIIAAVASGCFSTESAECRRSLQLKKKLGLKPRPDIRLFIHQGMLGPEALDRLRPVLEVVGPRWK